MGTRHVWGAGAENGATTVIGPARIGRNGDAFQIEDEIAFEIAPAIPGARKALWAVVAKDDFNGRISAAFLMETAAKTRRDIAELEARLEMLRSSLALLLRKPIEQALPAQALEQKPA